MYITVKEASTKWNLSARRVCILCNEGRIAGAIKKSGVWMIPKNADKPVDGRRYEVKQYIEPMSLLCNSTYFEYKGIEPITEEDKLICEIHEMFLSGEMENALSSLDRLIAKCKNDRYYVICYMLRIFICADLGEKYMCEESAKNIYGLLSNEEKYEIERVVFDYYSGKIESVGCEIFAYDKYDDLIPLLSCLAIKTKINSIINKGEKEDVSCLDMICRGLEDKNSPLLCAYSHLYLMVYYNINNDINLFTYHRDKAVDILLPRGWYVPLAEYSATIELDFLKGIDRSVYKKVKGLSEIIISNYSKCGLFNELIGEPKLRSETNVKIAYKLVQKKNNVEIANELGLSQYKVKKHIDELCDIFGVDTKKEIADIVLKNIFV